MPSHEDSIISDFSHPVVPPVIGVSTYETIASMHLMLNANDAYVHSNLGNRQLGLLYPTNTPEMYNTHSEVPFEPPNNLGITLTLGANTMAAQINAANIKHQESKRNWLEYMRTDKALKQQLLQEFNEMYYRTLRNRITGYANITTLNIL